jgi:formylglycine-generating enzyme required for sulfatase activity
MSILARLRLLALGVFLVLLFSACHLPASTGASGVTATPAEGEVAFELESGTAVRWVDSSYVVYVPPGEFVMGQDEAELVSDHEPAHTVSLDGFWIHQTEVTNQMYAACVAAGICSPPDQDDEGPYSLSRYSNHPVVNVDWTQAETYCEWILGRLPTEAEWEKAARGDEGKPYPWGEDAPTCDLLNAADCLDPADTSAVRDYALGASPYKLADVAGNVFEWVYDWFDEEYYAASPAESPTGPTSGEERVFRGSSYQTPVDEAAVYLRNRLDPQDRQADLGFRCVLSGETVGNPPPPMCEVAGYTPPDDPDESDTPEPYPINAYCQPFGEGYITPINIVIGYPVDVDDFTVTSPLGDVYCYVDPAFPDLLVCDGPGLPMDHTVDITICSTLGAPPLADVEPSCPAGYYWNAVAHRCRSNLLPPMDADCGPGYFQTDAYGCVPLATGINADDCPVGFGMAMTFFEGHEKHICIPTDGDAYCEDNPGCSSNQTCTVGTYIPEAQCCEAPEDLLPSCELGYHYNIFAGLCQWEGPEDTNCVTQSVTLPACEDEDIPPDQSYACSDYTSPVACAADPACRWVQPMSVPGPGHCEDKP